MGYINWYDPAVAEKEKREKRFAPPRRPNVALQRTRMQSSASNHSAESSGTTDSELYRQELALVPKPLALISKPNKPAHFTNRPPLSVPQSAFHSLQPPAFRQPPLRKSERSSRLRELSGQQRRNSDDYGGNGSKDGVGGYSTHDSEAMVEDEMAMEETSAEEVVLSPYDSLYANPATSEYCESVQDETSCNPTDGTTHTGNKKYASGYSLSVYSRDDSPTYVEPVTGSGEDKVSFDDNMDVDSDELPNHRRDEDSSSLLGGSSITTIKDSPTRYEQGRDVGLPSSSPQLPTLPRSTYEMDRPSDSTDIPSSPPVPKNPFQEAWDLQERTGTGYHVRNKNNLHFLEHRNDSSASFGDPDAAENSNGLSYHARTQRTPPTLAPLSFEDIQALSAAGKVLRARGCEQGYLDYVSSLSLSFHRASLSKSMLTFH